MRGKNFNISLDEIKTNFILGRPELVEVHNSRYYLLNTGIGEVLLSKEAMDNYKNIAIGGNGDKLTAVITLVKDLKKPDDNFNQINLTCEYR